MIYNRYRQTNADKNNMENRKNSSKYSNSIHKALNDEIRTPHINLDVTCKDFKDNSDIKNTRLKHEFEIYQPSAEFWRSSSTRLAKLRKFGTALKLANRLLTDLAAVNNKEEEGSISCVISSHYNYITESRIPHHTWDYGLP